MNAKNVFAFLGGVVIGAVGSMLYFKKKYQDQVDEELESLKLYYDKKLKDEVEDAKLKIQEHIFDYETFEDNPDADDVNEETGEYFVPEDETFMKDEKGQYRKIASIYKSDPDADEVVIFEDNPVTNEKPYTIKPEEFGDDGRDTEFLTYYADGILTDNGDEVVEDVEKYVGLDNLQKFGEYESDVVHVRNPDLRIDYEITLDSRTYTYVVSGQ